LSVRAYEQTAFYLNAIGPSKNTFMTRWVGYAARMAEMKNAYKTLVGKPEGKYDLEDLGTDGRTL
jgi:hypothetical protein